MFGIVGFKDLKISCIIGIKPEERLVEQDLLVTLEIEWDFSRIAAKDNLTEAVDYVKLAETCIEYIKRRKYHMLETLAYDLITLLKNSYDLNWIKIVVKKPKAFKDASCSYVELEDGVKKSCGR